MRIRSDINELNCGGAAAVGDAAVKATDFGRGNGAFAHAYIPARRADFSRKIYIAGRGENGNARFMKTIKTA